jgi:hypothetical protein
MVNSKLVVEKKGVLLDWRGNEKRRRRRRSQSTDFFLFGALLSHCNFSLYWRI